VLDSQKLSVSCLLCLVAWESGSLDLYLLGHGHSELVLSGVCMQDAVKGTGLEGATVFGLHMPHLDAY
jgi:hypothetical protein